MNQYYNFPFSPVFAVILFKTCVSKYKSCTAQGISVKYVDRYECHEVGQEGTLSLKINVSSTPWTRTFHPSPHRPDPLCFFPFHRAHNNSITVTLYYFVTKTFRRLFTGNNCHRRNRSQKKRIEKAVISPKKTLFRRSAHLHNMHSELRRVKCRPCVGWTVPSLITSVEERRVILPVSFLTLFREQ